MDEINNSTFIFIALSTSHSDWTEAFPEEGLANVSSDEKTDSTADSVSFLEHLVEHNDNNSSKSQLENNEEPVTGSDFFQTSIHSRPNISKRLAEGDNHCHQLLSAVEHRFFFFIFHINLDNFGTGKELHNHACSNEGVNSKLHQRASVGGEDVSHPVEWITARSRLNSVEWDLTTDQENQ